MRLASGPGSVSVHSPSGHSLMKTLSSVLLLTTSVTAISFPIHAKRRNDLPLEVNSRRALRSSRGFLNVGAEIGNMGGGSGEPDGSYGNGSLSLADLGDTLYTCNILLEGKGFEVQIDTGSVDLWVQGDAPGTKNLSIPAEVAYGSGGAKGYINTAELTFDSYVVPEQAYINVYDAEGLAGLDGIIGLGPSSASRVRALLNSSAGDSALDRIFRQNMTTPNYLTVLLARSSSTESSNSSNPLLEREPDQLTIGEVVDGYENILNATHLPALVDQYGNQHWQALLDSNGIIGPDGKKIETKTSIENPTVGGEDQLHVVFDTGFSLPQVPKEVADAIYGVVPGAEFIANGSDYAPQGELISELVNFYRVPCTYELNVSFVFAGMEFPVAPLDLVLNATALDPTAVDGDGNDICIAGYQQVAPNIEGHPSFGALDMILGMGFLRNVYVLFNFGDFVDGSSDTVADPYIQLLSTVDKATAHLDFVNARLGGIDTTGSQPALLSRPDNSSSSSAISASAETSTSYSTRTSSTSTTATKNPSSSASSSAASASSAGAIDQNLDTALSNDDDDSDSKPFYQQTAFIVGISVAGGVFLLLIAVGVWRALRTRRSKVRSEGVFVPQMGSYKPLVNEGAPISYTDTAYRPPYEARGYGDVDEA